VLNKSIVILGVACSIWGLPVIAGVGTLKLQIKNPDGLVLDIHSIQTPNKGKVEYKFSDENTVTWSSPDSNVKQSEISTEKKEIVLSYSDFADDTFVSLDIDVMSKDKTRTLQTLDAGCRIKSSGIAIVDVGDTAIRDKVVCPANVTLDKSHGIITVKTPPKSAK
jgi:hypothetical protein